LIEWMRKAYRYLDFEGVMSLFEDAPYLAKYGLKEAPYSTKPDERYLFLTPTHQEAIAMVGKVVRDREGAALIYGKYGTGKTTLMRRIYAELRDEPKKYQVGVIENAGHCPTSFQMAGEILESFGERSEHNDRKGRYDQIKQRLLKNYKSEVVSILLVDEAQELPAKVLEGLRGYLNFETNQEKMLQLVLFALPNIVKKLAYAKTLRNRLWRSELSGMTRPEMDEMLRWRFVQAGGAAFPFDAAAVDHIYQLTKGHPRSACGLAQLALELAALRDGRVTVKVVNQVKNKRFLEA
jgi:general secretion pathway protein A